MGGNAVEVQELERSQPQRKCNRLGEPLLWPSQQAANAGVEGNLPAQDTHNKRRGEVAVFGRERFDARRVQKLVAVAFALANKGEDLKCRQTSRRDFGD